MFCDYCIEAGVSADKSTLVKGCSSMRLESIKYHEGSNMHLLAANKHINKMKPSEAPVAKAQHSLNKALLPKLQHLFHNIHAINMQAQPYSDYIWMNELDEQKGFEVGSKYRSAYACREFSSVIAGVSQAEISQ